MKTSSRRRAGWEAPTCQACQKAKEWMTPTGIIPVKSLGHPSAGTDQEGVWICYRCDQVAGRQWR